MSPQEIYQLAVAQGFSPQAAVTMTAIALAESSGNPGAVSKPNHNGTIDRGLWQINSVHQQYDQGKLVSDPGYNARAAYQIAGGGSNFRPWSTYNSGAYKAYLGEAQQAASATPMTGRPTGGGGIGQALGGTTDTGTTPAAPQPDRAAQIVSGLDGSGSTAAPSTDLTTPTPTAPTDVSTTSGAAGTALKAALAAVGTPYKWGGNDMKTGVDCSGLIQQAYKQAGIDIPRVSDAQIKAGTPVDPSQMQPGDLLGWTYNNSLNGGATHVAMYIGGGKMVEALHTGLPVHVVDVRTPQYVTRITGSTASTPTTGASTQQPQFNPDDSLDSRMSAILGAIGSSSHGGI